MRCLLIAHPLITIEKTFSDWARSYRSIRQLAERTSHRIRDGRFSLCSKGRQREPRGLRESQSVRVMCIVSGSLCYPQVMDHVAIMKKEWELLPKILSGEKKIESRWSRRRVAPWGKIEVGETIYFKDSGEPVTAKATVEKVLAFEGLTPAKVRELLERYGEADGSHRPEIDKFYDLFKDKKYCLFIFLGNPQKIAPFRVSKQGFGLQAAWLCVNSIKQLQ